MRIYKNCVEAVTDIGRELKKCATTVHTQTMQNKDIANDPDFKTKEIQAFSFAIINPQDRDEMPQVTLDWCKAEFKERINTREDINPGEAWLLRKDVWEEFLNEEGRFDYTYNFRIAWQIEAIIKELKEKPQTRQAIIEVHDRNFDQEAMGKKRIPCSMFYQFMLRDGKLDVIYVMRSSDFSTHFQNDIWQALALRDHIAAMSGYDVGKFFMFVSSLHIYKKDWDLLSNY